MPTTNLSPDQSNLESDSSEADQKCAHLPIPPGRICCIDFGLKRIGVALSNPSHTIATKLICLNNEGFAKTAQYFEKLIREREIGSFVVGWPLTPNGDESSQCKLVHNFCVKLYQKFQLPIFKFDERNSTSDCQSFLRKKVSDDIVAVWILQGFLEQASPQQAASEPNSWPHNI